MLWALLATFAQLLIVLKIGRGLYLLWLAFKAGKSALRRTEVSDFKASDEREAYGRLFRQGILMHIGNPEVIFYLGGLYVVCAEAGCGRLHAANNHLQLCGGWRVCVRRLCSAVLNRHEGRILPSHSWRTQCDVSCNGSQSKSL